MALHDTYQSPLIGRYSSQAMQELFGDNRKFRTWRKLWLELARAEQALGIDRITDEALQQMEANLDLTDEDYIRVAELEKKNRHDVMSHARRFGEVCPAADPIIHLGATSCEVDDNTYLIVMREALGIILFGLRGSCIRSHSSLPHGRPHQRWVLPTSNRPSSLPWANAQPCGRRICSWT